MCFIESEPDVIDANITFPRIRLKPYKYNIEAPLFIKFECTVRVSEDDFITFPVSYIPSCIFKVLESNSSVFENITVG